MGRPIQVGALLCVVVVLIPWVAHGRTVSVDFARQTAESSDLIFGGCGFEYGTEYRTYGMKLMRTFTRLDRVIPDTRNVKMGDKDIQTIIQSKKNGYVTMTALMECPASLTWTGTKAGVPRDWAKYQEVVKILVGSLGDNIDYIEIANEPDWAPKMLDPAGSGLTHLEAYLQMYRYTHKAIRDVNKRVKIGGPAFLAPPVPGAKNTANSRAYTWLEAMLTDPYIRENIEFVSYHNYQAPSYPEQFEPVAQHSIAACRRLIGRRLPVFNTEWNSHYDAASALTTEPEGFDFHGKQFIAFLTSGLTGSAFYTTTGFATPVETREFYLGAKPAYPRVWVMAAHSLGLSTGPIRVFSTELSAEPVPRGYEAWSVGCINGANEPCVLLLGQASGIDVTMKGLTIPGEVVVEAFLASPENAGRDVWKSWKKTFDGTPVTVTVDPPAHSVVGIRIRGRVGTVTERAAPSRQSIILRPQPTNGGQGWYTLQGRVAGSAVWPDVRRIGPTRIVRIEQGLSGKESLCRFTE